MTEEPIVGKAFFNLTLVERFDVNGKAAFVAKCNCGRTIEVLLTNLKYGFTKSCGCAPRKPRDKKENLSQEMARTKKIWKGMFSRCNNQNTPGYKNYGGRGIRVCIRWHDFENFIEDMGCRPPGDMSIDRINVNGNYEPGNCRWATRKQQARNKTNTVYLTYDGETKSAAEWAEITKECIRGYPGK